MYIVKYRIKKEITDSGEEKYYVQYSHLGIFWKYIENGVYYGYVGKIAIFNTYDEAVEGLRVFKKENGLDVAKIEYIEHS